MSIIKDLFGKDNGITENDLKNIKGKYQETSIIECKLASALSKNRSVYYNAIKTVIGFLNKPENDSAGLLMIGIDAPKGVITDIVKKVRHSLINIFFIILLFLFIITY